MESTDDFLSNEYLHDYATTIFDVFDDSPGESETLFAFCVIKKMLNIYQVATLLKMFLKVYRTHFCKNISSSIDVRVNQNLLSWLPDYQY